MKMNNFKVGVLVTLIFLVWSCDPVKRTTDGKQNQNNDCPSLNQVDGDFFQNLSSADYQLNDLRQDGNSLEMDIVTNVLFDNAQLYWTGAVRKSYPPQAAVKLILEKSNESQENMRINNKHQLCFDITAFKTYGDRIKVYVMDDEEAIDLKFQK